MIGVGSGKAYMNYVLLFCKKKKTKQNKNKNENEKMPSHMLEIKRHYFQMKLN